MTTWKEVFKQQKEIVEDQNIARKKKCIADIGLQELLENQKKEDKINQLLTTWGTEIQPNLEILDKCGIKELLEEINVVSFRGTGNITDDSPKNKNDYCVGEYLCEYKYKPCILTLSAKYLDYKPADSWTNGYESGGYPEDISVENIKISVEVEKNKKDRKIKLCYRGHSVYLDPPNLVNQDEIDQFKKKLLEELATKMLKDSSFPFTELCEKAKKVLNHEYKEEQFDDFNLSKLVNGDKILVECIKIEPKKEPEKRKKWFW